MGYCIECGLTYQEDRSFCEFCNPEAEGLYQTLNKVREQSIKLEQLLDKIMIEVEWITGMLAQSHHEPDKIVIFPKVIENNLNKANLAWVDYTLDKEKK